MASENRLVIRRRFSCTIVTTESPPDRIGSTPSDRGEMARRSMCVLIMLGATCIHSGCKDGPMYALKHVNPYYPMSQWASDEKIGVTDHQRRQELQSLADTMPKLTPDRQQYWSEHLRQIFENDESPEMRRLAVLAAGRSTDPTILKLIEKGLQDDVMKVRMEACRALGTRQDAEAANLLAATIGSSQDKDVRHAAITALAKHPGKVSADSLKMALQDRDPATQSLVIGSLRESTGKDYGNDPQTWIAALEGKDVAEKPRGGLRSFF